MNLSYLLLSSLLILLIISGLFGLFLFKEYIKKISCLSVSYSGFIVFVTLISFENTKFNEILAIIVTILIIFIFNLLLGIGIARKVSQFNDSN